MTVLVIFIQCKFYQMGTGPYQGEYDHEICTSASILTISQLGVKEELLFIIF